MTQALQQKLFFPVPTTPEVGSLTAIAPGVRWLRMALPYQLNHINLYILEDDDGLVLFDTGLGDGTTIGIWERLLHNELAGQRITRLVVSHFHPDHIGMAGWLQRRSEAPLFMSQTEYIFSLALAARTGSLSRAAWREFYRQHGFDPVAAELLIGRGHAYLDETTGLPQQYERLQAGETLRIGGRDWEILTGGGHALEQVMLLCRADRLLLCADQIIAKISPNISVTAMEPHGDPLGDYLRSLAALRATVPEDVLTMPAHNLPFRGAHARIDDLVAHHAERCDMIADGVQAGPLTAAELVPVVFKRALDPHQTGFALSEVLAHVNLMLRQGRLAETADSTGVLRVRAA